MADPGQLTKQRAVERMLETLSIFRVLAWADADDGPPDPTNADEVMAFRQIDDAVREVNQRHKYQWNWQDELSIPADINGKFPVPANTARITRVRVKGKRQALYLEDRFVERDGFVYNATKDTFTGFGSPLRVELVYWPGFEKLPSTARHLVLWEATRRFVRGRQGVNEGLMRDIAREGREARRAMEVDSGRRQFRNVLEGPSGAIALRRRPSIRIF